MDDIIDSESNEPQSEANITQNKNDSAESDHNTQMNAMILMI